MERHLIVREPFADYVKGDHIDDPAKVAEVMDGGNRHHVILVHPVAVRPEPPPPAPEPEPPAPRFARKIDA